MKLFAIGFGIAFAAFGLSYFASYWIIPLAFLLAIVANYALVILVVVGDFFTLIFNVFTGYRARMPSERVGLSFHAVWSIQRTLVLGALIGSLGTIALRPITAGFVLIALATYALTARLHCRLIFR